MIKISRNVDLIIIHDFMFDVVITMVIGPYGLCCERLKIK
jgi:hypothetical protein